jgi:hypothetical protein
MSARLRRLAAPLAVGAATLAATAYVGVVDPNEAGHYPLCPTKLLTGLDCPGCGGLRAVHSLANGDLLGAIDHNAYVVLLMVPAAVVIWLAWVRRAWRGVEVSDAEAGPARVGVEAVLASPSVMWSLLALTVVFTVVRNIGAVPELAWLASGAG